MGRGRADLPRLDNRPLEKVKSHMLSPVPSFAALGPEEAQALLGEHSPPLATALAQRGGLREELFARQGPDRVIDRPLDRESVAELFRVQEERLGPGKDQEDEESLMLLLRRVKERVFVHLGLRDLGGAAHLGEVTRTLTLLAELALEKSLASGLDLILRRRSLPPWPEDAPLFFCVLGMGKLGGRELNYSSDVDLIYLYDPGLWPFPDQPVAAETAAALGALIGRVMSRPTGEGLVFRVDLDLRPAGKDGPLAPTMEAARRHYIYRAADWERLALIKARAVAGNRDMGDYLVEETYPFVYRRHLDYTALEELRRLKKKFASRPGSQTRSGFDLKLGRGGIRQVEFFVQTLQLIYGGRTPKLRTRATLETLSLLLEQGLITPADQEELERAYVFLRTAEHRLQLRFLQQTQSLPLGEGALARLAKSMGFQGHGAGEDFLADLDARTQAVAERFESLLREEDEEAEERPLAGLIDALDQGDEDEALDVLATAGFQDPRRARSIIEDLRADSFLSSSMESQRNLLNKVLPAILEGVLRSSDPDTALVRLESFLARIGPKTGLFMLLLQNPATLELLVRLMSSSAYLARVLTAHPGIMDGLIDSRSQAVKTMEDLKAELHELTGAMEDEEERAGLIRRFKAEETVRIAVQDLTEGLTLERISDQLSDLAEAVLGITLDLAGENLARRYSPEYERERPEFAVLGLGKLGGRELAYHADLDVLFLFRPRPGREGGRFTPAEYAIKLAQRAISLLSVPMAEGPGYELDARLRPSGRQGPLCVSLESFREYHRTSQVWERLALLKSRTVSGDTELCRAAREAVQEAVFERELDPGWAGEIRRLRQRMLEERAASSGLDLKMGRGGLVDVEFAAQTLQIFHGRNWPELRTPHILRGLTALERVGIIDPETYHDLFQGYRFLRLLDRRLRLIHDRGGDRVGYSDQDIKRAGEDPALARQVCRKVARAYDKVMETL